MRQRRAPSLTRLPSMIRRTPTASAGGRWRCQRSGAARQARRLAHRSATAKAMHSATAVALAAATTEGATFAASAAALAAASAATTAVPARVGRIASAIGVSEVVGAGSETRRLDRRQQLDDQLVDASPFE